MHSLLTFKGLRRGMVAALCLAAGLAAEAATKTQFLMLPQRGYYRVNRMRIMDTDVDGKMSADDSHVYCAIYDSVPRNKSLATGARVDMVNGIIYVLELPMTGWNQNDPDSLQTGYIYTYDSNWNAREATDSPFLTVTARGACSDFLVTRDEKYVFFSVMEGTNKGKILRWTRATGAWDDFAVFTSNTDGLRGLAEDNAGNLYVAQRAENKIYRFKMDHEPYEAGSCDAVSSSGSYTALGSPSVIVYRPADGRLYVAGWSQVAWFDAETLEQGCEPVTVDNGKVGVPGYTAGCISGGEIFFSGGNGSMNGPIFKLTGYDPITAIDVSPWTSGWTAYDFVDWQPAIARQNGFGAVGTPACEGVLLQGGALAGATGVKGGALALPNDASTAALADSAAFVPATAAFTVSFWANLAEGATGTLFSNRSVALTADADGKLGLTFGETAIATEAVVADGAWHVIAFTRSTTALNLWMDGANVGSATIAEADAVDQMADWTFGPVAGDAFVDEFRVYGSALALYAHRSMAAEFEPAATPEMPEQPADYEPLDPAIGQEIEHVYANDAALGAPQLLKFGDKFYLSYAVGGVTKIKVSSDGAAWSDFSTLAATGVSLFRTRNALLGAFGQTSPTSAALWTYDSSAGQWNERLAYSGSTRFTMMPGAILNSCNKYSLGVLVENKPFSGTWTAGILFLNANAGVDSFDTFKLKTISAEYTSYNYSKTYSTVRAILPACGYFYRGLTMADPQEVFEMMYPAVDGNRADGKAKAGAERFYLERWVNYYGTGDWIYDDWSRDKQYVSLPGASKTFAVVQDSTTGLFWALTTPVLKTSELLERSADTIRNRLALYVSKDLTDWAPCGTVAETGTADTFGYNAPFALVDGNDLLVAFGVSADDGAIATVDRAHSNYLAIRRIANFRTNYVAEQPTKKSTVLYALGCESSGTVARHALGSDGEWHSAGWLMQNSASAKKDQTLYDGEGAAGKPTAVAVDGRGNVFIANTRVSWDTDRVVRIFSFNRNGTFKKLYKKSDVTVDPVGLAVSRDGSRLYCSTGSKIWKIDVASGVWSEFATNGSGDLGANVYFLAVGEDGTVYAGNQASPGQVTRWSAAGEFLGKLCDTDANGAGALALDEANGRLFVGARFGALWTVDLSSGAKTAIRANTMTGRLNTDNSQVDSGVKGLAYLDGKIYVSSSYGHVVEIDPETGAEKPCIGSMKTAGGIGIYKYEPSGTAIIVR